MPTGRYAPSMSQSHRFVVGSDEAPVRLDVFLRRRLTGVSRSYVQKAIDEGHATVGSRRRAKGYLLSPGDEIVLEGFVRPEDRALSPNANLVVPVVHLERSKPWKRPAQTSYFSSMRATASPWSSAVRPVPPLSV